MAVKAFTGPDGGSRPSLLFSIEQLTRLGKNPHIVSILDVGIESLPPYYAMDYLEHGSLEQFVCMRKPAPPEKAAHYVVIPLQHDLCLC